MIRSLIASLQFLTRLPIPGQFEADELGRSINLFAVGGLVIGAAAGGVSYLLQRLGCPWTIRAVCITVFLAGVTGGMHLDGVADTFDGLMSGKRGEKLLEVMRDSRIGTMGAVALWAVLSLKAASIAAIPDPLTALLLACGAGRACLTGGLAFFPYAGGGLAAAFAPHAKKTGPAASG